MLEFYEAYADYQRVADVLEAAGVAFVAGEVGYDGELDFTPPWRRITLRDAILEGTGVDVLGHPEARRAAGRGVRAGDRARPVRDLAAPRRRPAHQFVEPSLRPAHLPPRLPGGAVALREGAPVRGGPGSASSRFVAGIEFGNAFTELNDPDEQRARFEEQHADGGGRRGGDALSTRTSSARSSTGCRRPAGSASASTGS